MSRPSPPVFVNASVCVVGGGAQVTVGFLHYRYSNLAVASHALCRAATDTGDELVARGPSRLAAFPTAEHKDEWLATPAGSLRDIL